LADGLKKGPLAPTRDQLLAAITNAVFTPVCGETPNPTDSGNLICRRVRQVLGVNEDRIKNTQEAMRTAANGDPVVFVDDFIGSGDQFLSTWQDENSGHSFELLQQQTGFPTIYISLVGTESGIQNISQFAPSVAVCVAHKFDDRQTLWGLQTNNPGLFQQIDLLLKKYTPRLTPHEMYMLQEDYLTYGYKRRGLFFGFEHSVPDATLPIFWCRGRNDWEPLIERT